MVMIATIYCSYSLFR